MHNQTHSVKNSSIAFSPEIAGKVYTADQLAKLNEEEVENCLIITKLSYQARW